MEGLHCLKYVLQKGDYMCKTDLKNAYFSVPLPKDSRKLAQFLSAWNLYEFLYLCFGLGLAPRKFTKLLKVPILVLRRLITRIIIYLDNLLILGNNMIKIFMTMDCDFPIATSKPCDKSEEVCARSCTRNRVLGVDCEFLNYGLSLLEEKIGKIKDQHLRLYKASEVSLLDLTKLIGKQSLTIQVVRSARLQFRFL